MSDLISKAALAEKLKAFYGVEDGKVLSMDAIAALSAIEEAQTVDVGEEEWIATHDDREIVLGCIRLIEEVLNGEFGIFQQLKDYGFDFEEYEGFCGRPLSYMMSMMEIVGPLLLEYTSHSGGTTTRKKCREMGFNPSTIIEFEREEEDDERPD